MIRIETFFCRNLLSWQSQLKRIWISFHKVYNQFYPRMIFLSIILVFAHLFSSKSNGGFHSQPFTISRLTQSVFVIWTICSQDSSQVSSDLSLKRANWQNLCIDLDLLNLYLIFFTFRLILSLVSLVFRFILATKCLWDLNIYTIQFVSLYQQYFSSSPKNLNKKACV